MKIYKAILISMICIFFCTSSFAWELVTNKNGIKVYTTKKPQWLYNSFKAETVVDGSLVNVLSFMKDVENYKNWMWMAEETKKLKEYNANDFIMYAVQSGPGPLRKRDIVIRAKVAQNPKNYAVVAKLTNKPDFIPRRKKIVRVTELGSEWRFYPLANNKVRVVYEGHANPGGSIGGKAPKWIVNRILTQMPYQTLKNMKKVDLSKFNFKSGLIKNPPASFFKRK